MTAPKRKYKVLRRASGGRTEYRKWPQWAHGDIIVGKYLGTHVDQYGNKCPIIEIEEAMFKDGTGPALAGKVLTLNNTGMIESSFYNEKTPIEEQSFVQVTYNGTSRIEKGPYAGTESHLTLVEVIQLEDTAPEVDL